LLVSHTSESNQTESCADSERDHRAASQQKLQVQTTGDIEDFEEIGSAMCNPFGAPHGTSVYNFASDDGHYQFGSELLLLDEGGKDYATCVAGLDPATNDSLDGSSRGKSLSRLWY
jgi:hypothetical protein